MYARVKVMVHLWYDTRCTVHSDVRTQLRLKATDWVRLSIAQAFEILGPSPSRTRVRCLEPRRDMTSCEGDLVSPKFGWGLIKRYANHASSKLGKHAKAVSLRNFVETRLL
jgi:hypothetical protein